MDPSRPTFSGASGGFIQRPQEAPSDLMDFQFMPAPLRSRQASLAHKTTTPAEGSEHELVRSAMAPPPRPVQDARRSTAESSSSGNETGNFGSQTYGIRLVFFRGRQFTDNLAGQNTNYYSATHEERDRETIPFPIYSPRSTLPSGETEDGEIKRKLPPIWTPTGKCSLRENCSTFFK